MKKAIWSTLLGDSPTGLAMRVLADLIIAVVLSRAFFVNWRAKYRREHRLQRRFTETEYEGQVELLKSEVSLLKTRLTETQSNLDILIGSVKRATAFDRETDVTPEEGGRYTFIFAGCEPRQGTDEFVGFYACPLCSGRLEVPEHADSDGIFKDHLGTCSGLNRAISAKP